MDRARAETLVFRLARQERDVWVTWPARVAALMAAEVAAEVEKQSGEPVTIETTIVQRVLEPMSEGSWAPSPISASPSDSDDLTEGLDLSFDGAETLLRPWRRGMRLDPDLTMCGRRRHSLLMQRLVHIEHQEGISALHGGKADQLLTCVGRMRRKPKNSRWHYRRPGPHQQGCPDPLPYCYHKGGAGQIAAERPRARKGHAPALAASSSP